MARILLVDDHSTFARSLQLVVENSRGLEVAGLARTLAEGREIVYGEEPFDLAVVDLTLPDGDGAELVREITRRRPGTPVVLLSARDDIAEVAREVGADAALHKATPLQEIVATLRGLAG